MAWNVSIYLFNIINFESCCVNIRVQDIKVNNQLNVICVAQKFHSAVDPRGTFIGGKNFRDCDYLYSYGTGIRIIKLNFKLFYCCFSCLFR
jgi:hypothetical protein